MSLQNLFSLTALVLGILIGVLCGMEIISYVYILGVPAGCGVAAFLHKGVEPESFIYKQL